MPERRSISTKTWLAVAGGVILSALMIWQLRPSEPEFQRFQARYWIGKLREGTNAAALETVPHLGTNFGPYLAHALQRKTLDRLYSKVWPLLPAKLQQRFKKPTDWARMQQIRANILAAVVELDLYTPDVIAALAGILNEREALTNYITGDVVGVLGNAGGHAASAVPALCEFVSKAPTGSALQAPVEVLGNLGPDARLAVPVLIQLLQRPGDDELRRVAAIALGHIGPDARAAVPALIDSLSQSRLINQVRSAEALARIDPAVTNALPLLRLALKSDNLWATPAALHAWWLIEGAPTGDGRLTTAWTPRRGVPTSVGVEPTGDGRLTTGATRAVPASWMIKGGPSRRELSEIIRNILREQGQTIEGATVLAELDPTDVEAAPTLIDGVRNGSMAAARALPRFRPSLAGSVPALVRLLHIHDSRSQICAAETLAKFGAGARAAAPALVRSMESNDPWVRTAAAAALGQIDPQAAKRIRN